MSERRQGQQARESSSATWGLKPRTPTLGRRSAEPRLIRLPLRVYRRTWSRIEGPYLLDSTSEGRLAHRLESPQACCSRSPVTMATRSSFAPRKRERRRLLEASSGPADDGWRREPSYLDTRRG